MQVINYFFLLSVLILSQNCQGQTIFWQETFGLGCNQGGLVGTPTPTNGAWSTTQIGVNGPQANEWFISATESGLPTGQCGNGCIGTPSLTNKTLHVGSNIAPPNTDPGAIYLQNVNSATNKRVQSPDINCSLYANIIVSFNYLSKGVLGSDYTEILYSADSGSSWTPIGLVAQSVGTCSPNGLWANVTYTLPMTADGNPNVKIGFRWENGTGTGPGNISVALDDITFTGTLSTSIKSRSLNNEFEIKLFPNPVKDKLTLEFEHELKSLDITNNLGQLVYVLKNPLSKQEIDLSFLSSGVYYLKAQNNSGQKVFKVIKE